MYGRPPLTPQSDSHGKILNALESLCPGTTGDGSMFRLIGLEGDRVQGARSGSDSRYSPHSGKILGNSVSILISTHTVHASLQSAIWQIPG